MEKILVVDDDKSILKVMHLRLKDKGYQVTTANKADDAVALVKGDAFDLALVDLKLNGKSGIELMKELHEINPEMPIIILTAHGTIDSAVEAMKKGAYSYLTKPFDFQDLLLQINKCLEKTRLLKEIVNLRSMVKERYGFENIIGKSGKMKTVIEQAARAAESDSNVYIEGESGTGKELIAKTVHVASQRREGPFVAINCSAIPENLLESELFGYEKGAFTGATRSKKGLFCQAENGSLLLDEISEMPLSMQVKLLRVLQEREFYPLGGEKLVSVDVRIIAASNKNIAEEVEKGSFREDLFYRIHVIPITLPPLRERRESIPLLANHFLEKHSRQIKKNIKGFSKEAIQRMLLHTWPGNVRELENVIECAVAMSTQNVITEDLILQTKKIETNRMIPLKDAKENFERDYIIQLIEFTQGNVSNAAKLAGKYRADLYELLKKYNIDPADFRR